MKMVGVAQIEGCRRLDAASTKETFLDGEGGTSGVEVVLLSGGSSCFSFFGCWRMGLLMGSWVHTCNSSGFGA